MKREEALKLIESKIKNKTLLKHMLATEACMKALARYMEEDEGLWGLAGLLHDLDYEETIDNFPQHGLTTAKILAELDVNAQVIYAIQSHTGQIAPKSMMAKTLYAVDPLTGLIVAAVLMHPSKSLLKTNVSFILEMFHDADFAKEANRTQIQACTNLGITLPTFVKVSLEAMQDIAKELEL
jgi:uncharacterized protein